VLAQISNELGLGSHGRIPYPWSDPAVAVKDSQQINEVWFANTLHLLFLTYYKDKE
jgi:hypothetical protein